MLDDSDARRRATIQRTLIIGLWALLLGAVTLVTADTLGWAQVSLAGIVGLVGVGIATFTVLWTVNHTQASYPDAFLDRFFWTAMIGQLPAFAVGAGIAGTARPMLLAYALVLFAMLFLRARPLQVLAYGGALGAIYLGASVMDLLVDGIVPLDDVAYLVIWLPFLGVMAALSEHVAAARSRLEVQRAAMQSHTEQRQEVFRRIAHDLRNPLTMLLGPLDDLLQQDASSQRLRVAFRNAQRLARLVDRLQRHAASESVVEDESVQPLELTAFVRRVVEAYYDAPAPGGVTVRVHVHAPVHALANPPGLETILVSLVAFALEHSPSGGQVGVYVHEAADGPRVVVSEQGTRDEEEERSRTFSSVYGSANELAIVRRIAGDMGARVGVDGRPGLGSHLYVVLPAAPDGSIRITATSHFGQTKIRDLDPGWDTPTIEIPVTVPPNYLLVVEVDEDLRRRTCAILERAGWTAVGVSSSDEALVHIGVRVPELIVTDWTMSTRDHGPELVVQVRRRPELASTPVVLLTSHADPVSRTAGLKAGADAFIAKPFERDELVSTVTNLLRLRERDRSAQELDRKLREEVFGRFLPAHLVADVIEGRASFDDAPRTLSITTLVVDIVGFTELTERMRAGGIARYLSSYFELVSDVVAEHDGFVDKFLGDGVLVHFGALSPLTPEAQVGRAVACARALHHRIGDLDREWRRRGLGITRLRVGIHHGPAAVGYLGTARRTEYTAVGPAVNTAFRVSEACRPGETWISGVVADYLDLRDVAAVSGIPAVHGVAVFRLTEASALSGTSSPHPLGVGDRVGPYRVVRLVALGGMAMVYEVHHETLDRSNALKILIDGNPELTARLVEEGKIQGRLQSPNIVPVLDVVDVRGAPALVMPLVLGCTLEDLLARHRMSEGEAVAVAGAIATGLAVAHGAGVVHRDLKPANVLLDAASGVVIPRVADFGLARDTGRARPGDPSPFDTKIGQFLGTPVYAAPEQFRDASGVGPAADVWALGTIFYELLTGHCAFVNGAFSLVRDQVEGARFDVSRVPERWRGLVERMVSVKASARPSADEVSEELAIPGVEAHLRHGRLLGIVLDDEPTQI